MNKKIIDKKENKQTDKQTNNQQNKTIPPKIFITRFQASTMITRREISKYIPATCIILFINSFCKL